MTAAGKLDNQGLSVDELTAQSNQAKLKLSYRQTGFSPSAPKTVEAEIRHLELDRRLAGLPAGIAARAVAQVSAGRLHRRRREARATTGGDGCPNCRCGA